MTSNGSLQRSWRVYIASMNSLSASSSRVVDADDVVVEGLGALEVGEVVHQRPHLFAAADQHIDKPGDVRPDGGDAVVVELDDDVFDLIGHIVEVVADLEDIFPLDGGDERL